MSRAHQSPGRQALRHPVAPSTKDAGHARPPPTTATIEAPGSAPAETVRENRALRYLVAAYRQLSGLALHDADLGSIAQLIAGHLAAAVAVVNPEMDVLAAAAPGETPEKAEQYIRDRVVHPRLAQVHSATGQNRRVLRLPDVRTGTSVVVAPIRRRQRTGVPDGAGPGRVDLRGGSEPAAD